MKRNLSNLGIACLMSLSLPAWAQEQKKPEAVTEGIVQIGAQLGTTANAIEQMLERLKNQANASVPGFHNADFRRKTLETQKKVREASLRFKEKLASDIFPEIGAHLRMYEQIYKETQNDPERENRLNPLRSQIESLMARLSERYQQELFKLYEAIGIRMLAKTAYGGTARASCGYEDGRTPACNTFVSRVLAAIASGCASRSCLALSAAEQITFFAAIESSFDNNVNFVLADGKPVVLAGITNTRNAWSEQVGFVKSMIGSASEFPQAVNELSFDVPESQVDELLAKTREQLTATFQAIRSENLRIMAKVYTEENRLHVAENICLIGQGFVAPETGGFGCMNPEELDMVVQMVRSARRDNRDYHESQVRTAAARAQAWTGIGPAKKAKGGRKPASQAQAQPQAKAVPEPVSGSTEQIQAQLGVTSNSIQSTLERLRNKGKAADGSVIPVEYQNADFRRKSPALAARIETALGQFRETLKTKILDPIGVHISRYNAIATSGQYSYQQKLPYLAIELKKINEDMDKLSALYRQEVLKLYAAGGIDVLAVGKDSSVRSRIACEEASPGCLAYMSLVFPALEKDCATYSCVGLSASDHAMLFVLVKQEFDRHITFVLADPTTPGESATKPDAKPEVDQYGRPTGPKKTTIHLMSINQNSWKETIDGISGVIYSPLYHPRSVQELPSDITEAELPAGLEHARKVFNEDYKAKRKATVDAWVARDSYANGADGYENLLQVCLLGKDLVPAGTPGFGCVNRSEGDVIVRNLGRKRDKYNDRGEYRTARMTNFRVNATYAQQASGVQPAPEAAPARR
jgi:hypothetical protein